MSTYETLDLILSFLAVILILVPIWQARIAMRDNYSRERKQATIEYFLTNLQPVWRESMAKIREQWGDGPLSEESVKAIEGSREHQLVVLGLLDNLEVMALSTAQGIYDRDIIAQVAGPYLQSLYQKLRPYLEHKRRSTPETGLAFEQLVQSLTLEKRELREAAI